MEAFHHRAGAVLCPGWRAHAGGLSGCGLHVPRVQGAHAAAIWRTGQCEDGGQGTVGYPYLGSLVAWVMHDLGPSLAPVRTSLLLLALISCAPTPGTVLQQGPGHVVPRALTLASLCLSTLGPPAWPSQGQLLSPFLRWPSPCGGHFC